MPEFRGTPEEFLKQAQEYSGRKYALAEFPNDFEADIPKAIEAGETPEYWVDAKAEKCDLDPVTNGWI